MTWSVSPAAASLQLALAPAAEPQPLTPQAQQPSEIA